MTFRFTRVFLQSSPGGAESTTKLTSLFDGYSTSRNAFGFDHVIMDIQPFAGHGSSFIKDLIGPEKDYEVARYVYHNAVKSVFKRLKPRKTFALLIDGTDPMFKLRRIRKIKNKKAESRFLRCAGAPMAFAIEDRLMYFVKDQSAASKESTDEYLISGPCAPGPFESKMSSWMMDLGQRTLLDSAKGDENNKDGNNNNSDQQKPTPAEAPKINSNNRDNSGGAAHLTPKDKITRNDTVAIIGGGSELPLVALAATPFHNITVMISERGELKSLEFAAILGWYDSFCKVTGSHDGKNLMKEWYNSGQNVELTRARIDVCLIHMVCEGFEAIDLGNVNGMPLRDTLTRYFSYNLPKQIFLTKEETETGDLVVDPAALEALLCVGGNVKIGGRTDKNLLVQDHLEVLMQGLVCLADGGIKNYSFLPQSKYDASNKVAAMVTAQQVVQHLRYLHTNKKGIVLRASKNPNFAVTPAEMLFLAAQHSDWITNHSPYFTGGFMLPENIAETVIKTDDVEKALVKTQGILAKAKEQKLHRGLGFTPSHLWKKTMGSAGPPAGFKYYPVNLGITSSEEKSREKINTAADFGVAVAKKIKNPLVSFDKTTRTWLEYAVGDKDLLAEQQQTASSSLEEAGITELKVVNWNVQFNRYSGKTTPLGKQGIDWCSPTRYIALSRVLSRTDADVIGMQEVEAPFWNYLSIQEWVRNNYYFSTSANRGSDIDPWGNLMLIKKTLPIVQMGSVNVPGHPGHTSLMPSCTIRVKKSTSSNDEGVATSKVVENQNANSDNISINVCHLLAPYTQGNVEGRKSQIERLIEKLSKKNVGENAIVMGDFNDYPSNFFGGFPKSMGDWNDSWVKVHGDEDGDAGWTINGKTNTYTSLLIEPDFFGRADRIYVKSNYLEPKEASLIGTQKVSVENNINLKEKDYLFPSDHYGVMVKYDVKY